MSNSRSGSALRQTYASRSDVTRVLGDMDDVAAVEILGLHPTIADIEAASMRITGDDDIATADHRPDTAVVDKIVEILAIADEEDRELPAR